ncbi:MULTISPECIES: hypothetical protein [Cyanophyceae]|nr:hypothetical protein [Trichocoleus sp. FACHB-69]MBD1931885.1 hypothetical protein [Trichocoleus sp. FACHB-69]
MKKAVTDGAFEPINKCSPTLREDYAIARARSQFISPRCQRQSSYLTTF